MKILSILDTLPFAMTIHEDRLPETLTQWVNQWILKSRLPGTHRLIQLAGDGSTRTFFRLEFHDPAFKPVSRSSGQSTRTGALQSYIVLYDPSWSLSKDYPAHQAYLQRQGVAVPRFHAVDTQVGCLVMDDLGDELLQSRILSDPPNRMRWLEKATSLLAELHGRTYPVPGDLPVHGRRFDRQKYRDELLFTSEHLREKLLGLPSYSESDQTVLEAFCLSLDHIGVDVFCHRDYHTRNLLVKKKSLWLIDFQDARMGPIHYDLASLLFDAYVPTSPQEREDLTALYRQEISRFPLAQQLRWETFAEDLARVAFQRVVKAAGSFASFYTRYGKRTHLPYLVPALRSARDLQRQSASLSGEIKRIFPIEEWLHLIEEKEIA